MGESLSAYTERLLAGLRADVQKLKQDFRGASTYAEPDRSPPNLVVNAHVVAHGWSVGQVIGYNGAWELATGTLGVGLGRSFYRTIGVIGKVVDADNVLVVVQGVLLVTGAVALGEWWVDPVTAGNFTSVRPIATIDQAALPVFTCYSTDGTTGMVWVHGQVPITEQTLDDCRDVNIDHSTLADGDGLFYDLASQMWVNLPPGAASFGAQSANKIFAGPSSGGVALPTFRDMVMADLPTMFANGVIGNDTAGSTTPVGIYASTTGQVLVMGATVIGWGYVDTASLVNLAVTTAKIDALAVTTAKIAANAVTTAKMDVVITAGGPTGSASVVPVITYDAAGRLTAVTTAAITPAAIGAVDTGTFTAYLSHTHTLTGDVTGTVTGATTIAAGAVDTGKLASLAVTTAKIAAGAITTTELGGSAVTTAKIAAGAVTTGELGALAVTTAKIAAGAVTTTEIAANAVTTAKMDTVGTPGTYGDSTHVAQITTDAAGRVTGVTAVAIAGGGGGGSPFGPPTSTIVNTVYTTAGGPFTHTFDVASTYFIAQIVGGGGGGSSGTSNATSTGSFAGGGGGAGGTVWVWGPVASMGASMTVIVGGGGAGGVSAGAAGSSGGFSDISGSGGTWTADGGGGGDIQGGSGLGGSPGVVATDFNKLIGLTVNGQDGKPGHVKSVDFNGTGNVTGVNSAPGAGGRGVIDLTSSSSIHRGNGGLGGNAGSTVGNAGLDGFVRVWEYK